MFRPYDERPVLRMAKSPNNHLRRGELIAFVMLAVLVLPGTELYGWLQEHWPRWALTVRIIFHLSLAGAFGFLTWAYWDVVLEPLRRPANRSARTVRGRLGILLRRPLHLLIALYLALGVISYEFDFLRKLVAGAI